jgi:hypothetical protein
MNIHYNKQQSNRGGILVVRQPYPMVIPPWYSIISICVGQLLGKERTKEESKYQVSLEFQVEHDTSFSGFNGYTSPSASHESVKMN